MLIRDMIATDIPALVALADAKRTEYAAYSPVFWRKSAQGVEVQSRYFANRMLPSDEVISLVADDDGTIVGFVMGIIRHAPPVYEPGGPVCWIDDFTVAHPDDWATIGAQLYAAVTARARERGAVAMVTITGHDDAPKRAMLRTENAALTVETYVQALTSGEPDA